MKDESMSYLEALKEIKRLKEAVVKIKEEINQESHYYGMKERFIGVNKAFSIIDKYRGDTDGKG